MKDIFRHIISSLGQWKLILLAYVCQFAVALFVGVSVYNLLGSNLGNSGGLVKMAEGWDYTTIQDFLYHHFREVGGVRGRVLPLLFIYLFISSIVSSGIWSVIHQGHFSISIIGSGIRKYLGRFFSLSLAALLVFILWTSIIWLPFVAQAMSLLEEMADERFVYYLALGLILFWLIGVLLLMSILYAARAGFINYDYSFLKGLRSAFQRGRSNWSTILGAIALLTFIGAFLVFFTVWLEAKVGITSAGLIIASIIMNQLIVLFRIIMRLGLISYVLARLGGDNV